MKRLAVCVTETADAQIEEQILFISVRSPANALVWGERVYQALHGLGEHWGHAVDVEASRRYGLALRRYVFEKNYLVFYEVDEPASVIRIISFRHGARVPNRGEP